MYVCYSWLQVHHLLRIDLFLRLWPWSLCQVSSWIQPLPLWPEIRSCRNPGCCCTRSSCWGSPPTKLQANAPVVDVQLVGTWAHRWPLHISVRRLPARLLCCKNVWLRKYVTVIVCQCISGLDVWERQQKRSDCHSLSHTPWQTLLPKVISTASAHQRSFSISKTAMLPPFCASWFVSFSKAKSKAAWPSWLDRQAMDPMKAADGSCLFH